MLSSIFRTVNLRSSAYFRIKSQEIGFYVFVKMLPYHIGVAKDIIKIMSCVEGDRSDCQPETNCCPKREAEGTGGCKGPTVCSVTVNT